MSEHPTTEQSLHSIALSLIEINRELKETRRTQHSAFRFSKQEANRSRSRPEPKKPNLWSRFWAVPQGSCLSLIKLFSK